MIACKNVYYLEEVKSTRNIFGIQILAKGAKIVPKTRFFAIFSSFVLYFSLKLHTMIACNNAQHLVEVKPTKNISGDQVWVK